MQSHTEREELDGPFQGIVHGGRMKNGKSGRYVVGMEVDMMRTDFVFLQDNTCRG